uniref:Actin-related protein 4 n=1 Tax=Chlamydomonas leiostraca TaxID=1034604 RepID=A0A7S0R612_9CHLO|mmetsp:Transcript_14688/g.36593  ORF Transcript_14688/g.36593 Transcript_14688/m.36593 type:complete len:435 (+) Transcript_14688:78-1382(+)
MTTVFGGDEVNALVVDVGTSLCRAGYAGDDVPKAVFPSSVGVLPAEANGMEVDGAGPSKRKLYVGQSDVNYRRDNMEVVSPFSPTDDSFQDWDMVEAIWDHAFRERLRVDPTEYAVLAAEANVVPRAARERVCEIMFEKLRVPALYLAKNAVLSAFATARQTGLVVDAGYRGTTVAAVHDGYVLQKSVCKLPVGGQLLNTLMQKALEGRGFSFKPRYQIKRVERLPGEFSVETLQLPNTTPSFHNFQVEALVADVREALAKVNDVPYDEAAHAQLPTVQYELPDGQEILVGADRLKVPEVYFQPGLLSSFPNLPAESIPRRADGSQLSRLQDVVVESINKCDVDVRKDLYQGVILTGGVSGTTGLRDRLERELAERGPNAARIKVTMPANPIERRFSVWIGGSILSSLGSFQQMWMSKKEYEEHGAGLIHRKAP